MSLIINMLKDLERRQNTNAAVPPMKTSHQSYTLHDKNKNKRFFFVGAVLIISLISVYLFMHRKAYHESIPVTHEVTLNKTEEIINKQDEAWLTPVTINAVSYATKDNVTEIVFGLSHNGIYRVGTDNNGKIILSMNNASMLSDMPTLVGAEVGIQNITASNVNGVLKFAITLKPGAFLQSLDTNFVENKSELIISIANAAAATIPEQVTANTNSIKTPAMQTILMEKYHDALKAADTGNKAEAINSLNKLLQYYPDYQDVRVSLAAIILESGNPIKARAIIDEGLLITPDYLPLIELKARLLTSEGKIEEAIMVLQSEKPLINEAPSYHALIAALYNRTNNNKIASEIYQQLVQINPHEGSWWFGLGVSLDKLGHNPDAMFAYTKAATEGRLNSQAMAFLHSRLRALQEEKHAQK